MTTGNDAAAPFFDVPLDLSHAGTIAARIRRIVYNRVEIDGKRLDALADLSDRLVDLLLPYRLRDENLNEHEAAPMVEEAAVLGRALVEVVEQSHVANDRLGQCVRNLFECLGKGREGAEISLRAGENPRSLQRPA